MAIQSAKMQDVVSRFFIQCLDKGICLKLTLHATLSGSEGISGSRAFLKLSFFNLPQSRPTFCPSHLLHYGKQTKCW
jgi:hypothetical protein